MTSTPSQALPSAHEEKSHPFLELAVQRSPNNPPAAWLWRDPASILKSTLRVRVGGSFTWPPHGWSTQQAAEIKHVVFVSGGVGINPLISMLSSIFKDEMVHKPKKISFLYSTKLPSSGSGDNILFLPRLLKLAEQHPKRIDLTLFLTNLAAGTKLKNPKSLGWYHDRRIDEADLTAALGDDTASRRETVVYVCGPPKMTDDLVAWFSHQSGMDPSRVLCEKWW